jgi:hypothetical protein
VKHWPLGSSLCVAALIGSLGIAAGCDGCRTEDQLAELIAQQGRDVDRDTARALGKWHRAILGDRFHMGDGLRTGAASTVELSLTPSGQAHVEPHTVLRFLPSAPESLTPQVALEQGTVEIMASSMDLEIHTPKAVAKLVRGSKLKLTAHDGHERFDLLVGRVSIDHEGTSEQLQAAHPLELGAKDAAISPATQRTTSLAPTVEAASTSRAPEETAPEEANATAPSVTPLVSALPALNPARTDVALKLETATLHAADLPVQVHLTQPPCNERTHVQLLGKTKSEHPFVLSLPAGRHKLRILCGEAVVEEALIVVKRDAGKVDLPRRAQNVRVEADGRKYTVLYQNLLPTVTFVWPGSHPAEQEYTLLLRRGKREQQFIVTRPEHAIAGSALGEGEHKFWFRDAEGRSSKPGTLRVSFDDAARSAYLLSPVEGSPVTNPIVVEGAALLRSEVTAEGQKLTLDDKGRFRSEIALGVGRHSVTVRVQHPESGVHYYVRRLR